MLRSAATLKTWSETPRTLAEEMLLSGLASADLRAVDWKGPKMRKFLDLAAPGPLGQSAVKMEAILRMEDDAKVTCHVWQAWDGSLSHPKVKTS